MSSSLHPLSAFFETAPKKVTIGTITLSEQPNIALASLAKRQTKSENFSKTAQQLFTTDLPEPGHMTVSDPWTIFWMGPDHWMVMAPHNTHEDIAVQLKATFEASASLTEQSDAWVVLHVSGPETPALFKRCCVIDIERFTTHSATRTAIEHTGCFVLCVEQAGVYHVITPRSSAESVFHALETAALSIA